MFEWKKGTILAGLSYFFPFLLRVVPQILFYPFVVGYDTPMYVATLRFLAHQQYNPYAMLWLFGDYGLPFFSLFTPVCRFAGIDPTALMMILPPVFYGLTGFAAFYFARHHLKWSETKSFLASMILVMSYVTLRVSWDLHKNIFSYILMLLAFSQFPPPMNWKRWVAFLLLAFACCVMHPMAAITVLAIMLVVLIKSLVKKEIKTAVTLTMVFLAIGAFGLLGLYLVAGNLAASAGRVVMYLSEWRFSPTFDKLFIFVCNYGLVLVLTLCGLFGDDVLAAWTGGLLFMVIMEPSDFFIRWMYLLTFPFAFYTTNGMYVVMKTLQKGALKSQKVLESIRVNKEAVACVLLCLLYISTPSIIFVTTPITDPFPFFVNPRWNARGAGFPWSMLCNTVGLQDNQDLLKLLTWLNENAGNGSCLITGWMFLGQSLSYLDFNVIVFLHGQKLNETVQRVLVEDFQQIYYVDYYSTEKDNEFPVKVNEDFVTYKLQASRVVKNGVVQLAEEPEGKIVLYEVSRVTTIP